MFSICQAHTSVSTSASRLSSWLRHHLQWFLQWYALCTGSDANNNAHVTFYNHNESIGVGAKENQYARIPDISDSNALGLYNDPTAILNGDLCHWITNSIGSIDEDNEGMYNSTAIKSEGNGDICVAYYTASSADRMPVNLKPAVAAHGSPRLSMRREMWVICIIRINSQNQPYIAYMTPPLPASRWPPRKITYGNHRCDTEGSVGMYADLDIDNNDIVHITYLEDAGTKGKLRYAWGR